MEENSQFSDAAYQGREFSNGLACVLSGIQTEIVKRFDCAKRFEVLPKRWIVERTIAWHNRCRRLAKDWKNLNRKGLAFLPRRLNPLHAAKAMQSSVMFPCRLSQLRPVNVLKIVQEIEFKGNYEAARRLKSTIGKNIFRGIRTVVGKSMKRPVSILFASTALLLAACASQPINTSTDVPGFFTGLFHGLIALVVLMGSLFWHVRIYAFPNSGWWYDLGFVLGFGFSNVAIMLASMAQVGGLLVRKD